VEPILVTTSEMLEGESIIDSLLSSFMGGEILEYASQEGDVAVFEGKIPKKEERHIVSRLLELRKEIRQRNNLLASLSGSTKKTQTHEPEN